jgi:hypothetical protein
VGALGTRLDQPHDRRETRAAAQPWRQHPERRLADELSLCTLWIPHSYPACAQHAPNEHLLASVAREGLRIMAGLFWDLGEPHLRGT